MLERWAAVAEPHRKVLNEGLPCAPVVPLAVVIQAVNLGAVSTIFAAHAAGGGPRQRPNLEHTQTARKKKSGRQLALPLTASGLRARELEA